MFASLLVANRAEIACRIFRTARSMGIRCVGVHSEADAKAKHVREADESVLIGPAPASESYLRGDRIIEAARRTGAEAIHPGYGFLSENPDFAEAVIAAGLIWVGPSPASIRAMGLKDEAKRIAEEAGVPVVPGYRGLSQDAKTLGKAAKEIGFPVLIKAVAGGGGRGIREVHAPGQFGEALASARREAAAAFGDDRVIIEKLIERPRHIEVQVFGDKHGGLVHMFERDCSLQRRRQKVIEEAPAPGMTEEVRAAMTDAALKVARAVNYENAGTVEFIVDGSGPLRTDGFWFLEMNTRLQVEHPVTEAVTGLDLVEWQLRVATGETLPRRQHDISLRGHAIEARICAEDPSRDFMPSVGRLAHCVWPSHGRDDAFAQDWPYATRLDAGFAENDAVPAEYDSLIAKVIVRSREEGEDENNREHCENVLRVWLSHIEVWPCVTNAGFLLRCLDDRDFRSGTAHTGLIGERLATLADRRPGLRRAAAELAFAEALAEGSNTPWGIRDGWRLNGQSAPMRLYEAHADAIDVRVCIREGGMSAFVEGERFVYKPRLAAKIVQSAMQTLVFVKGDAFAFEAPGASREHADAAAVNEVKAPLPGKVVAVIARAGEAVKKGEALMTLEAMKMEHALKAPRDGVIAEIAVKAGAQVKEGALLVRLEEEAE